ncbi:MAG TPA: hypothetical protein VF681_07825 [Abditibacteriaceae bacterium]|jgi:hypothetical protein
METPKAQGITVELDRTFDSTCRYLILFLPGIWGGRASRDEV